MSGMDDWKILSGLRPDDRAAVLERTRLRAFARGEVLFHAGEHGDALYLIASGVVAVRVDTVGGAPATVNVLGPGAFVGELSLIDDAPRVASVVGVEPGEARILYRRDFDDIVQRHPSVRDILLRALADRVRAMTDQVVEVLSLPAEERVVRRIDALVALAPPGSDEVTLHVTQDDIASMAGTTRETVNRVLRARVADGRVRTERGRLVVSRGPHTAER